MIYAPADAAAFPKVPTRKSMSLMQFCSSAHPKPFSPVLESVGFVYIEKKVSVIVFQSYQRLQVGFVSVHAEDTLGNDDYLLIHTVVFFKKTPELG